MKSQLGRAIFGLKPATMKISDAEHERLIEAIQRRDIHRAEEINRDHRSGVGRELAEIIRAASDKMGQKSGREEERCGGLSI